MSKYLYHGSSKLIKSLKPRPSKVVNNQDVVFAANSKEIAVAFMPRWSDNDLDFTIIDCI